ncbi:MAG: hypothetical protein ACMUIU_17105 [bacterium]
MIKKGRSSTNDSQEGLPVRFQRLKYGGKIHIEEFIDFYKPRAVEIVERIKHDKLTNHTNHKLYHAFQDKLPKSKDIASEALYDFADKIRKGIDIKSSQIWEKLREIIIEHTEKYFDDKYIKEFIHKHLKNVCQEVYLGSKEAEKKLLDYEKNVLILIQVKSHTSFLDSDHIRVSKQVISEFLCQVKKNGVKDNRGKEIRNFYSYLYTIIQRRMKDQYNRDINRFGRSTEDYPYRKPQEAPKNYADNLDDSIYNKELLKIVFNELLPILEPIEKFIIFEEFIEEKKGKEIIADIYLWSQESFSQSTLTRKRNRAIEKLRMQYKLRLTEWDRCLMKQELSRLFSAPPDKKNKPDHKTDNEKRANGIKMEKGTNNQEKQSSKEESSKGKDEDNGFKKFKLKHLFLI